MLSDCGSSMIMDALRQGLIDNVFLYFCQQRHSVGMVAAASVGFLSR
jgi:hypothetical protein